MDPIVFLFLVILNLKQSFGLTAFFFICARTTFFFF